MYYLDNPFILTKSQCKNNGIEMKDIKFQYSTNTIYSSKNVFNDIELEWLSESEEILLRKVPFGCVKSICWDDAKDNLGILFSCSQLS